MADKAGEVAADVQAKWAAAFSKLDADALSSLYSRHGFLYGSNPNLYRGKDGAKAYLGCMMPGFPNMWSIYGPNTNGALPVAAFHEMVNFYAMQGMEKLILEGKKSVGVTHEAYQRYNDMIDEMNRNKVWSDRRAQNYYWTDHNRSAVMNPLETLRLGAVEFGKGHWDHRIDLSSKNEFGSLAESFLSECRIPLPADIRCARPG